MHAAQGWLITVCLCATVLPSSGISQNAEIDDWLKRSEEASRIANERKARIEDELGQAVDNEWFGDYTYGDGLGVNVRLIFAPKSGFVFSWRGCLGLYDLNYGPIEWDERRLTLRFENQNERKGFQGISPEFVPVRWGDRHYLIAPDQFVDFANAINAGFEPSAHSGRFLVKEGDEQKSVKGQPDIPALYKPYLLDEPIDARVLSVAGTRTVETDWRPLRITTLVVDKGSMHGMFEGMELHTFRPSNMFETVTVTKVEQQSSEVQIEQFELDDPLPSMDWEFSTKVIGK